MFSTTGHAKEDHELQARLRHRDHGRESRGQSPVPASEVSADAAVAVVCVRQVCSGRDPAILPPKLVWGFSDSAR